MKLCKDCKWMRDPGPYAQCAYPIDPAAERETEFTRALPLVGFPRSPRMRGREITSCTVQRAASWLWARWAPEGRCGKEGRWFEQANAAQSDWFKSRAQGIMTPTAAE